MPSGDTFSMPPVAKFIGRYLTLGAETIDPFARNTKLASVRNDLDPASTADYHMEAGDFLESMINQGGKFDLAFFDPPYSPRQISELYKSIGMAVGMKETQSGALYKRCRDKIDKLLNPSGVVLSFGWSSNGMGKTRGYDLVEVMLVAHGGAHNDTICIAERKMTDLLS